jgi:hypothetical protein
MDFKSMQLYDNNIHFVNPAHDDICSYFIQLIVYLFTMFSISCIIRSDQIDLLKAMSLS